MKKVFSFAIIISVLSCGVNKMLTPSQADADNGSKKFSGLTLEDLKQGQALYNDNCKTCHMLFAPNSRNEEAWNNVVPPMVEKANKKAGKEIIDAKKQEQILRYLVVMGAKTATK